MTYILHFKMNVDNKTCSIHRLIRGDKYYYEISELRLFLNTFIYFLCIDFVYFQIVV